MSHISEFGNEVVRRIRAIDKSIDRSLVEIIAGVSLGVIFDNKAVFHTPNPPSQAMRELLERLSEESRKSLPSSEYVAIAHEIACEFDTLPR